MQQADVIRLIECNRLLTETVDSLFLELLKYETVDEMMDNGTLKQIEEVSIKAEGYT